MLQQKYKLHCIQVCIRKMCSHHNHARKLIYTKYYVQACYCVGNLTISLLVLAPKRQIQNLQKAYEAIL